MQRKTAIVSALMIIASQPAISATSAAEGFFEACRYEMLSNKKKSDYLFQMRISVNELCNCIAKYSVATASDEDIVIINGREELSDSFWTRHENIKKTCATETSRPGEFK